MDAWDCQLLLAKDEVAVRFLESEPLVCAVFWLNPRYLRGSDFLMRWSQGVWSEERLVEAVNASGRYYALRYGVSSVAPGDPREMEKYFERLEKAGLGTRKRPDLLVFRADSRPGVDAVVEDLGGVTELPFIREDGLVDTILSRAIMGVECENSLWKASRMPDYKKPLRRMRRLQGKLGMPKNAVLPTIILKEEDREPLLAWQARFGIPIHLWHTFYDLAIGISLNRAEQLITEGYIEPRTQQFQAPSGAMTSKTVYRLYHHYAYELAHLVEEPELLAEKLIDRNGHILPYVRFRGGTLRLTEAAVSELDRAAEIAPSRMP